MSTAPNSSTGNFVPENYVIPEDISQLQEFLKRTLENHSRFINRKDTAQYETVEVQNNQTYPGNTPQDKKYVYRKIFEFDAIAAGGTLNITHEITGFTESTRYFGTIITAVPDDRPLPYIDAAVVTNQVSMRIVGANIVIVNGATAPNITSGRAIIEFLKT